MYKLILLLAFATTAQADYSIEQVIEVLCLVESDGDHLAIGDNGQAHGELQIHPVMVAECNRLLGRNEFTLEDRMSAKRSKQMARVFLSRQIDRYQARYNKMPDEMTLANSWNMGSIFNGQNMKYRVRYKLKKEV